MKLKIQTERNKMTLKRILSHLEEASRLCNRLDLSALSTLEQIESINALKHCQDALRFTIGKVQKLEGIFERSPTK